MSDPAAGADGRSRSTRSGQYALMAVAAVALTVLAVSVFGGDGGGADTSDATRPELEPVQIRDLQEVTRLDGTLGFPEGEAISSRLQGTITDVVGAGTVVEEGDLLFEVDGEPVVLLLGATPAFRDLGEAPVTVSVATSRSGVVTWLPEPGDQVPIDGELVRIADSPVILLPGELPAWRNLGIGSTGEDVRQLEEALAGLGYDPEGTMTVDDYFSSTTGTTIGRWQEAHGLVVDERFTLGDAVFLPQAATIGEVRVSVGDSVNGSTVVVVATVGADPIDGADVTQLQEALARLGYVTRVSGVLGTDTTAAIQRWQSEVGAEPDGVVHLGEVVFLPAPVRITEATLGAGKPVNNGGNVLATSSSQSVVSVELSAADQELLAIDQVVRVEMPDGSVVDAVVTDIDRIARRTNAGDVVFDVTILLLDESVGSELDQAPVEVLVVTDSRLGVLAVPVTALLALAEGGYAVEVDRGGGATGLVAVTPGLYADGWVEVTSAGLAAGDMVVVP